MSYYDLYGFSGSHLREARELLQSMLNIDFCERDSTYHGGVYYLSGDKKCEYFILKENIDLFDNEPDEKDYSEYNYLLYINDTHRSSDLMHKILSSNKFTLLRCEKV